MLLGNYSVHYKSPGKWRSGGATGQGMDRAAFNQAGSQRGRYLGEAGLYRQSAFPDGYGPGTALVIQQVAGGIASFTTITGTGAVSAANLAGGLNAEATIAGAGLIADAAAGLIVPASATIAGTGGLSGDIVGVLDAVASLSGSGSLAATIQAPASIVAALAGAATLSLDITATGALSATIEIGAQGELTPAGLAAALLDGADAIETGLTLRQALRIIAAATAGKVSGGGTTTITFRSAEADDTDRIVATVDSNGNRTAITLDLD